MSSLASALRQSFEITPTGTAVSLRNTFQLNPVLRLRRSEANRTVVSSARPAGGRWQADDMMLALPSSASNDLEALLNVLALRLSKVASRPLTPTLVTKALSITNQERLRWTKDGRLPTSGTAQLKASSIVTVPTYAANVVTQLRERPALIQAWRDADRAQ